MKYSIKSFLLFGLMIMGMVGCGHQIKKEVKKNNKVRYTYKINDDWSFKLGDSSIFSDTAYNAESWRKLDLPHDWSIEGTYDTIYGTDWQSGYLPAGIGWYRKDLYLEDNLLNLSVELQFDGVYRNSTVWVNNVMIGTQHYGYTTFFYDIGAYLKQGKNTIAVRVDNSRPKSARWYTGAGIYRNVWLKITPKIHFKTNEDFVQTSFLDERRVSVKANSVLLNNTNTSITGTHVTKIFDSDLKQLALLENPITLAGNDSIELIRDIELENPQRWSLNDAKRHIVVNEIYDNKQVLVDSDSTFFGIRKIEFSPEWGFKLNDKNIKVKGVCMHHDAGVYGAAVPESILLYRLKLLKKMGCNAIRTSHNPFSPEFYTMCDTLGILVLDEIFDGWEKTKAADDYGHYFEKDWKKDVSYWVKNNRNHPSIFMYSIGNEVAKPTVQTQRKLIDFIKGMDGSRPITQGGLDPTRGMKEVLGSTQLDVKGFNGDGEEMGRYESFHGEFPKVPMIATEVPHTYQTRGVYKTQTQWRRRDFPAKWEIDNGSAGTMKGLEGKLYPLPDLAKTEVFPEEKTNFFTIYDQEYPIQNPNPWKEDVYYQSSYDNATVRTSARKAWQRVEELNYLMGQFRWTGFDYLGETNQWPSRFANFGVIDIANMPKDAYYLYQSLWSDDPMVHMLPHWTHPGKEGVEIPVVVYTNTDMVELFLNEVSLGKQYYKGEQLKWMVPYTPGKVVAKAYKNGELVARDVYETASGEKKLKVSSPTQEISSKSKENTLVFIDVVDHKNSRFPLADDYLTITVSGPGKLKGLDNGDPLDLTPYTSSSKRAFRGRLVAFIEAEGEGWIDITVKSRQGLESKLRIESK
ncbi:sugar-binding domain-containing protein [Flagellimonas sp. MMG031]|uniref:Sugar-binding domain-containing protein n=1 Tax=Flagellimonas sp. MMG031 TaxID=3158549 RepID=A0AAU7MWM6_9FLAO